MKSKTVIIILSVLLGVGAIIGGIFLFRKRKLEQPLAGTSGTVNEFRNFLMGQYVEHVRGKNKQDLQKWVDKAKEGLSDNQKADDVKRVLQSTGASDWAVDWIMSNMNKNIKNGKVKGSISDNLDKAVEEIVEWQATQTNFSKLQEQSQGYGYWFREMALKYPKITDKLVFLENIHITGINVN